jgi:ABC-2 type transport system ATP-binding protein
MIRVENLKKQYKGIIVLNVADLFIPKGECFGLVGNNGAGKTTLFRIILDLIKPTEGQVLLDDINVARSESWKNKVGAYLDEHMLLSYLTPDEYFETLGKIHNLSKEDVQLHLGKFTELFNEEIIGKKKFIRDLSKGNLKKVGIAAAMIGIPEVIMLDEPFENLDPSSQVRLKKLILQEKELQGSTFLISSHDLNHVTEICDRIVLLEKGSIIKDLREKDKMAAELNSYFGT